MSEPAFSSSAKPAQRPEFRNLDLFSDIPGYRMPPAAFVSILHRVSGAVMFILLPVVIWLFDIGTSSVSSFEKFSSVYSGSGGWFLKIVTLVLIWAYLHHFCAGLRHLFMDATHNTTKEFGKLSAIIVLVISLLLTVILGFKLFLA
jgi:succinate dehydrogenase / fumarate reductase cytochrome b subunit